MSFYPPTENRHANVRRTDFKYIHPTSTTQAPSVIVQAALVQIRDVTTPAASRPLHDGVPNLFPQRARVDRRFILISLLQSTPEDGRIMNAFEKMDDTSFQTRTRQPNSRRNSTEVNDSPPVATISSSRTARGSRKYEEWMEYNEARLRSMSIEETVEEEEYGDLYDYRPVTSEQRRHHRRINDGGDGTGSLRSRHARDERTSQTSSTTSSAPIFIRDDHFETQQGDIIIDDKTIIIFQNGASAHITMSDLPPGDEGDDEVCNDRAIAGRVNKWMARNEAYYSQSDQSKLVLPAPPTTWAASHSGKAPISSTASRASRSYRSVPLKYYSEDTKRPE
ncbi:hypothetical protein I312_106407 [Cryptococcus bacillisporus CA1280]|uniref:uncharacterized protein n=1 Tax=Cryptococcus bacillisporus CA1280 TaxID=1296109 RepID=UPI0033671E1F